MDTAELLSGRAPFPAMDYGRCLPTPTCTSFWRKPIDGGTQNGRRERKKAILM